MNASRLHLSAEAFCAAGTLIDPAGSTNPLPPMAADTAAPNLGTRALAEGTLLQGGRFRLQRCLGRGGMGVVYQAFDAERDGAVALKILSRPEAVGIYRFKSEFRSLAHIQHPNLVRLHELFADSAHWYFTMDLVSGMHFDRWVRVAGDLNEARLRSTLAQLVCAVNAIHAAGKVHRDLKPSNVLVGPRNRVTVLDFGLVASRHVESGGHSIDDFGILGTPSFMAPEQAAGQPATTASDYYALGVMLFQALTGRLPFEGHPAQVLAAKQAHPAPSVGLSGRTKHLSDLAQLCAALLARDAADRPDPTTLLRTCSPRASRGAPRSSRTTKQLLFGREAELAVLREAFKATLRDESAIVLVSGESGIGKTALCEAFLKELRTQDQAVVLAGRCYERESVPFNVFDSLLDALTRHLRRLPPDQAAAILPRNVYALARLFPALARVGVVADAPSKCVAELQALQEIAFSACYELLGRLRDRRPLVLYIDDLQWTDHDSVLFLRRMLVNCAPIPLLLVASHREERPERNPLLALALDAAGASPWAKRQSLRLGPLSPATTAAIARELLGVTSPSVDAVAEAIAAEAAGGPFFATALVSHAQQFGYRLGAASFKLPIALRAQLEALPTAAQRLLHVLALVGQPQPVRTMLAAAEASHSDFDSLRAARFARGTTRDGVKWVECYHDRIRECVCDMLSEEAQRALYARLARVLLHSNADDDLELMCRCLAASGSAAQAGEYARLAADQAAAATAFERTAQLYAKALALGDWSVSDRAAIEVQLADALSCAGRGADAAVAYQRAAAAVPAIRAHHLLLKASEALLGCGHVREGEALLRNLCKEAGLTLPVGPRGAAAQLFRSQWQLRLRGLRFRAQPVAALAVEAGTRLNAAECAVRGFIGNRPLLAANMADRYLILALNAGQLGHVAVSLGYQAYFHSLLHIGDHARARVADLLSLAEHVVERHGWTEGQSIAALGRGFVMGNQGRWTECRAHQAKALAIYRQESRGSVAWRVETTMLYDQIAAFARGDFLDLARVTPKLVKDAFNRGRLWGGAIASGLSGVPGWLAADDLDGARRQLAHATANWTTQRDPGWPEYLMLLGEVACELYSGQPERAHAVLQAGWGRIGASSLSRAWLFGVQGAYYRGASGLAAWRMTKTESARAAVHASLTYLRRAKRFPGAESMHAVVCAGVALAAGKLEQAVELLGSAVRGFEAAEMAMYAAAARRRLGALMGGDVGRAIAAVGSQSMRAQGVSKPSAMTDMLCPGCGVY